jgi:hypothetical protein
MAFEDAIITDFVLQPNMLIEAIRARAEQSNAADHTFKAKMKAMLEYFKKLTEQTGPLIMSNIVARVMSTQDRIKEQEFRDKSLDISQQSLDLAKKQDSWDRWKFNTATQVGVGAITPVITAWIFWIISKLPL